MDNDTGSFNLLPLLYRRGVAYVLKWVVFAFRAYLGA
jgi:hypothetical protein